MYEFHSFVRLALVIVVVLAVYLVVMKIRENRNKKTEE